jgi:hypothetical protein
MATTATAMTTAADSVVRLLDRERRARRHRICGAQPLHHVVHLKSLLHWAPRFIRVQLALSTGERSGQPLPRAM